VLSGKIKKKFRWFQFVLLGQVKLLGSLRACVLTSRST
jgi:hypothetical protein